MQVSSLEKEGRMSIEGVGGTEHMAARSSQQTRQTRDEEATEQAREQREADAQLAEQRDSQSGATDDSVDLTA